MGKDVDGPDRVGTQQWGRLAHRPEGAEHGRRSGSRASASQDRRAEHPGAGSRGVVFPAIFAEVRDRVVAAGQVDAGTMDAVSALLDDPNYWTQCWMMTAVWVRKPRA
jgi:hypothetical protein